MNKLVSSDARITDRFIYHEANSIRNLLLKQEAGKNRIFSFSSLFKTINKVELINVDTIEACGIDSDCIIKRTKYPLPAIVESAGGFIIRSITSLDGSTSVFITTDLSFARRLGASDKHAAKEPLVFIRNNHLYFNNVTWPYVKVEAIFENPDLIDELNNCDKPDHIDCNPFFQRVFPLPNYLEDPLKKLLNESLLRYYHQLREDQHINKSQT